MEEERNPASYRNLLEQFELTKKELGDAEENIRKITGRDPGLFTNDIQGGQLNKWKSQTGITPNKTFVGRNKRPLFPIIKDKEVLQDEESPEEEEEEIPSKRPSLPSTVVATPKDLKSRRETIQEQNINSKVKARNRRMFGMILGTLQKFQRDAKKREEKDLKRAVVEQKVEAAAAEEKERIKKEKEDLFQTRREKQIQLRCLEKKIEIAELHEAWENSKKHLVNFMVTSTQPPIYYLPAFHSPESKKLLEESKAKTLECIRERREKMEKELLEVEELYKKDNFPIDKENIGPMEDDELHDLTDAQENVLEDIPNTQLEPQHLHEELQNTHEELPNTSQELQNSENEHQNTLEKLPEKSPLEIVQTNIKTEPEIKEEENCNVNNEENTNNEQTDQDFEPIYD